MGNDKSPIKKLGRMSVSPFIFILLLVLYGSNHVTFRDPYKHERQLLHGDLWRYLKSKNFSPIKAHKTQSAIVKDSHFPDSIDPQPIEHLIYQPSRAEIIDKRQKLRPPKVRPISENCLKRGRCNEYTAVRAKLNLVQPQNATGKPKRPSIREEAMQGCLDRIAIKRKQRQETEA